MTSLIDKIELLIKREKTTPERKKRDDSTKSSSEILSELFSAFNADPPKIDDVPPKKSKKSKKKHKKEKKKRSRSTSASSSHSDTSEYAHKRKKRKKSKVKKRRENERSPSPPRSRTPVFVKPDPSLKIKKESNKVCVKSKDIKIKDEPAVKTESLKQVKVEEPKPISIDASLIPMPASPQDSTDLSDLQKTENKKGDAESDKLKGKIQIKNLKFSTVFEETVKKAEEEARKKAEKYEEGEYTDSSSCSLTEDIPNSNFPKTSDPSGMLKKQTIEETKLLEAEKSLTKKSKIEATPKPAKKDKSKSPKRSSSKSRRSKSPSRRHNHSSSSKSRRRSRSRHRSKSRKKSRSRSRRRSKSVTRRRSTSRTRGRARHSPRHRTNRRSSRSPTGVKLADSEKKRLLEVARRNAINMLKNGAVPAGAAALPPHTRNQGMAA